MDGELIDRFYAPPHALETGALTFDPPILPNEFVILRNGKKSALATYNGESQQLKRVDKIGAYGINPRNAEQAFALNALMNPNVNLVTISGKAGTGKTLLALASALECRKGYRQIFMARPVVPLSNKDIGYLPGDIQSKLDPYMQPLYDNLGVIQNQFSTSDQKHKRSMSFWKKRNWSSSRWPTSVDAAWSRMLLHRRRSPKPDPARGEDHHHPRRRGHQGGADRRHLPDRPPLPRTPTRTVSATSSNR